MENVKRTWVDYGVPRDWTDPNQGQVGTAGIDCVSDEVLPSIHVHVCVCAIGRGVSVSCY